MLSLLGSINSNEYNKKRIILFLKVFLVIILGTITTLWIVQEDNLIYNQLFKMILGLYSVGMVLLWIPTPLKKNTIRIMQIYTIILLSAISGLWALFEIESKGVEVFTQNTSLTLVNGLAFSMLLFLMTSGFFLIFGLADIINFAHGAFFMLGGFM